jgi:hypothetical protein
LVEIPWIAGEQGRGHEHRFHHVQLAGLRKRRAGDGDQIAFGIGDHEEDRAVLQLDHQDEGSQVEGELPEVEQQGQTGDASHVGEEELETPQAGGRRRQVG